MFPLGTKLFVRTVTFHLVGEIVERDGDWLKLEEASWVADSGPFHKALDTGSLTEVEYVGEAYVNLATATDAFPWTHMLPKASK
jgi:hypothetical protein